MKHMQAAIAGKAQRDFERVSYSIKPPVISIGKDSNVQIHPLGAYTSRRIASANINSITNP